MTIRERIEQMGAMPALLGAWAAIASAAAIAMSAADAIDGEAWAISRVLIGIVGLAAAALFWSGRNFGQDGMRAIIAWGVLQVPFYATAPDENWTRQLFDLFLGVTSQTTINGVITEYSQVGLNAVGIAIAAAGGASLKRLDLWRRREASARALARA